MESTGALIGIGLWLIAIAEVQAAAPVSPAETICHKNWFFDKAGHRMFVPSSMPLQFLLNAKDQSPFALSDTMKNGDAWVRFPEGEHRMSVSATQAQEFHLVSDGTPPKTKVKIDFAASAEKGSILYYGKALKFTLTPEDLSSGVSATYISVNQAPWHALGEKTVHFTQDGSTDLRYFSCDRVGNQEAAIRHKFQVDTTAPESSYVVSGPAKMERNEHYIGKGAQIALVSRDLGSGVQSIRYQIDNEGEQPYGLPLQLDSLKPGKHDLHFFATDEVQNKESVKHFTFIYDPVAPQIETQFAGKIFKDASLTYISPRVVMKVVTKEELSGVAHVECRWDKGAAAPCATAVALPVAAGAHTLKIEVKDNVGNVAVSEEQIFIDKDEPRTAWVIEGAHIWDKDKALVSQGARLRVRARDDGAGIGEKTLCRGKEACTLWKDEQVELPQAGEFTFTVKVSDRVGNESSAAAIQVVVNAEKNVAAQDSGESFESSVKKGWVKDSDAGAIGPKAKAFRLEITDNPANRGFILEIDKEFAAALLKEEKEHSLVMTAGGQAGHVTIPIDQTPPHASISLHAAKSFSKDGKQYFGAGLRADVLASDPNAGPTSGMAEIIYNINDRGFQTYKKPLDGFILEQPYKISFRAIDRVGNQGEIQTTQFIIDRTPPSTTVVLGSPHYRNVISDEGRVSLQSTDNLSGVAQIAFAFDKDKWTAYSDEHLKEALSKLPEGSHVLRFAAVDEVGNKESEKTFVFELDRSAPKTAFELIGSYTEKEKKYIVKSGAKVSLKASDRFSAVAQVMFSWDGGELQNYSEPVTIPDDGKEHVLQFSAQDQLAQKTPPQEIKVRADKETPVTRMKVSGHYLVVGKKIYLDEKSQITLTATDDDAGVKTIFYRFGSGEYKEYRSPIGVGEGVFAELAFFAVDNIGLRETPHQHQIMLDNAKPQIEFEPAVIKVSSGKNVLSRGSLLRVAAADGQSGIKEVFYQINGSEKRLYRGPIMLKENGDFKLEILARDWASHEAKASYPFTVE